MGKRKRKYKKVGVWFIDHPFGKAKWGGLKTDHGWVYAVRFDDKVKIGLSVNPSPRIDAIQVEQGKSYKEIHLIPADDCRRAERSLHYEYQDYRLEGEWFDLSEAQFEEIKTLKSYRKGEFRTNLKSHKPQQKSCKNP